MNLDNNKNCYCICLVVTLFILFTIVVRLKEYKEHLAIKEILTIKKYLEKHNNGKICI